MNKKYEIGVDEVGRGSIFGPVFAAAVVLDKKNGLTLQKLGVRDSKKLTPVRRKLLLPYIFDLSIEYSIGQASVREIEQLNIRTATELAMIRAVKKLKVIPKELIIDGPLLLRPWTGPQRNIISGDTKFTSIAAASIIAKEARDKLMEKLDRSYEGYFIIKNKGYGTKEHFLALREKGLTKLHRKSFLKKLNTF